MAHLDLIHGRGLRHDKFASSVLQLEQHQHSVHVASDEFRRHARAIRKADQDRGRLFREVECAGDDVAIRRDNQPRCGSLADQHIVHGLQTANRLNPHDGGGYPGCCRLTGLLEQLQNIGTSLVNGYVMENVLAPLHHTISIK